MGTEHKKSAARVLVCNFGQYPKIAMTIRLRVAQRPDS
jgi:hypothetical protein